jgi:DnaJ-class molecular chaperone
MNEGELICDKCKGSGMSWFNSICKKCQGTGKVDWIENIIGKKMIERIPTQQAIKAYADCKSAMRNNCNGN